MLLRRGFLFEKAEVIFLRCPDFWSINGARKHTNRTAPMGGAVSKQMSCALLMKLSLGDSP